MSSPLEQAHLEIETALQTDGEQQAAAKQALAVADILEDLQLDPEISAAALLHPLSSTGQLSAESIQSRYGQTVTRLVQELNQLGALGFRTAEDRDSGLASRQAESLRRMLLAVVTDPRLVVVRLAIELHRLRSLKTAPDLERRQAATEVQEVFAPLANRLGIWQIKWELEDLSFRFLDPETYKTIAAQLRTRRADREVFIQETIDTLGGALKEVGLSAEVAGRPKHIYSIWRKMKHKELNFERILDVHALRVLVESVADCYAALGIVHSLWSRLTGEFDDYIASPKDNGYRSLHTAVIAADGMPVEVQIRTFEMHEQSELGVASHWRYKEGGRRDAAMDDKVRWLRTLLEPMDESESAGDYIDRVRQEVFEDRVYVFSPRGDVIDLPANATPLDFAYQVHTEVGNHCRGARVNNRMVPLTYQLTTGEQVEIITAANASPSRDWLRPQAGYLASGRSRAKVRAWFRRQEEAESRPEPRRAAPNHLLPVQQMAEMPSRPKRVHDATARAEVAVSGLDDMLSSFAGCCNPVPPEPIQGYITQGRGVSIHRQDCAKFLGLSNSRPARVIELDWGAGDTGTFPSKIIIHALDRQGLLRDLIALVTDEGISILGTESHSDNQSLHAVIELKLAVEGMEQLNAVLRRMRSVASVTSVHRQKIQ